MSAIYINIAGYMQISEQVTDSASSQIKTTFYTKPFW